MSKTLAMYDYRKLPEKKNLTVAKIHRLWVRDFKDEKKWPIKTAKMSTLPGVYRLEYDKPPLTLRPADRQFRPDGYPLGIEDFKAIMGFPDKFEIYLHKMVILSKRILRITITGLTRQGTQLPRVRFMR